MQRLREEIARRPPARLPACPPEDATATGRWTLESQNRPRQHDPFAPVLPFFLSFCSHSRLLVTGHPPPRINIRTLFVLDRVHGLAYTSRRTQLQYPPYTFTITRDTDRSWPVDEKEASQANHSYFRSLSRPSQTPPPLSALQRACIFCAAGCRQSSASSPASLALPSSVTLQLCWSADPRPSPLFATTPQRRSQPPARVTPLGPIRKPRDVGNNREKEQEARSSSSNPSGKQCLHICIHSRPRAIGFEIQRRAPINTKTHTGCGSVASRGETALQDSSSSRNPRPLADSGSKGQKRSTCWLPALLYLARHKPSSTTTRQFVHSAKPTAASYLV